MYGCIYSPDARLLAEAFSPFIEMAGAQTAVFTLTKRQLQEIARVPRAAVAATAEAAILAARHFPGVTILDGNEAEVLGALPVDALPPDPEIFETLDMWGIRTLADLARLPEKGIAERLGERGLRLQRLARWSLDRPLNPEALETVYEEQIEFDHPLELLEPMLFILARFLNDLCARLEAQSLAAGAMHLMLNSAGRMLRLPFPTRDTKFLLKLAQHDLEANKPGEPVAKIKLAILPVEPRRIQHGLFVPAAPEPERLELTLGKIRGLVGQKNVKVPELRDTYRPGWSMPDSRLAFRYFRPPLEARVDVERGVPKHLSTRVCRGKIVRTAGPWRSSGDWWSSEAWNRDEWEVVLAGRFIGRIFCIEKQWFLEGMYD